MTIIDYMAIHGYILAYGRLFDPPTLARAVPRTKGGTRLTPVRSGWSARHPRRHFAILHTVFNRFAYSKRPISFELFRVRDL
jgi:hypothetical protein